jgi:hypothetical protein
MAVFAVLAMICGACVVLGGAFGAGWWLQRAWLAERGRALRAALHCRTPAMQQRRISLRSALPASADFASLVENAAATYPPAPPPPPPRRPLPPPQPARPSGGGGTAGFMTLLQAGRAGAVRQLDSLRSRAAVAAAAKLPPPAKLATPPPAAVTPAAAAAPPPPAPRPFAASMAARARRAANNANMHNKARAHPVGAKVPPTALSASVHAAFAGSSAHATALTSAAYRTRD